MSFPQMRVRARSVTPGVLAALSAALGAALLHKIFPALPALTAVIAVGILLAQIPVTRRALTRTLAPGTELAASTFMRIGVVLLGFKLNLHTIAALGWPVWQAVLSILCVTFLLTWSLGKLLRLPGKQPLLMAAGFSICGASAIGAVAHVSKANDDDVAPPIAIVTLCGTAAMAVLPLLWHPLGLSSAGFGRWVGASVHDVGQVVAAANVAGAAALATAVLIKLIRVLMLVPLISLVGLAEWRANRGASTHRSLATVMPWFVPAFLAAVVIQTFAPLPQSLANGVDTAQLVLLSMALFALGTRVRVQSLFYQNWKALVVGLLASVVMAILALILLR
ncbi:YeiH family protein [Pseudarthrobacter sp. J1738]|uniref:YeiH family protein n=1 Tax=unclassified Pseudarthrobacter TaxID=2647000 RepID=UPI003D28DF8A